MKELIIRKPAVEAKCDFCAEINLWLQDNGFEKHEPNWLFKTTRWRHKCGLELELSDKKNSVEFWEFRFSFVAMMHFDGELDGSTKSICEKGYLINGITLIDDVERNFKKAMKLATKFILYVESLAETDDEPCRRFSAREDKDV